MSEKSNTNGVNVGDRIGAWLSILPAESRGILLGFGTYVGDEVPPNEGQGSLTAFLSGERRPNPKLVLDSGEVVWGCECWWGSEASVKAEQARLKEVVTLTMAEARAGNIPAGWETHLGVHGHVAARDDFWGGGGGKTGKDFWS